MRPGAVLIEVLHIAVGLLATACIFFGAAWGYPQGAATIWLVGYATMAAVVLIGLPALLRAVRGRA